MCTVTITRKDNGFQIIMNRDERHDRPPEKPPQEITDGIFAPLDPLSGGTWIAHNKAGHWGCLLNGYFEREQSQESSLHGSSVKSIDHTHKARDDALKRSRGGILLDLLSTPDPLKGAAAFQAGDYTSFRLIIGSAQEAKLFVWTEHDYGPQDFHAHKNGARLLTSSSLRQSEIIAHRKTLFLNHTGEAIDFHTINKNPEIDPLMHRPTSRTKSITVMNINQENPNFDYVAVPDDFSYKKDDVKALIGFL